MATHKHRQRKDAMLRRCLDSVVRHGALENNLGLIYISALTVSTDYSYATVTIGCDGTTEEKLSAVDTLNRSTSLIRNEIASLMNIKKVPKLSFKPDFPKESEARIDEILAGANESS